MPGRHLTENEPTRAVQMLEGGIRQIDGANAIGIIQGDISPLWSRYRETGNTLGRRLGRPRVKKGYSDGIPTN